MAILFLLSRGETKFRTCYNTVSVISVEFFPPWRRNYGLEILACQSVGRSGCFSSCFSPSEILQVPVSESVGISMQCGMMGKGALGTEH